MSETLIPIQPSFAEHLASEWIDSWNTHDLERILTHYSDDITLISPVALKLTGDSAVRGKSALRAYFAKGLDAYPDLRFDLIETLFGVETIVLFYRNNVRGNKTAEVLRLNAEGKITHVWANYDK
ncbi:nuclear transport factor 2 family protein [Acidicapsa dinghuensis]|uniref:Nuclear transport factor 2 family protein n=1 Tax=Acidicapsa dinghuensis TaxID=2218256 RepID=A0ABW1E8X3_9BACT|nr:nuclear transport factor 2 family protein [Acidicapsa dinghuensis]